MKKKNWNVLLASLFVLVLAMPFNASAQSEKVWSIGPELGVNFSKLNSDPQVDNDFKPGVVAGVFVTYSIINTFGVTAKAILSPRGAQYTDNGVKNKLTLNYLEVPLLARFFLNKEGRFRPNLFVGPSFNFLFGGTTKEGDDEAIKIPSYKDKYNTFDFGVTGGLGLNYEIANETRLLLDARYIHGLSDITKDASNVKNQAINVSVGVSFGF